MFPLHHTNQYDIVHFWDINSTCSRTGERYKEVKFLVYLLVRAGFNCRLFDSLSWTIQPVSSSCNPTSCLPSPFIFIPWRGYPLPPLFSSDIPLLHTPDSFIPPLATTAVAHNATVTELGFSSVPPQWSVASIRFTTNWTRAYSKLFTIKPERRLSSCC